MTREPASGNNASSAASCPDKAALEKMYRKYNKRKLAWPDPVSCIYRFEDVRDREVAALIASSLAFGRVAQIHRSVEDAISRMRLKPSAFARETDQNGMLGAFEGFRHRWVSGRDLAGLMTGAGQLIREHGTLESAFAAGVSESDDTLMSAAASFCARLSRPGGLGPGRLVPSGAGKCAFKRVNLMLRWMVRRDEIDPGGWESVRASKLVVPLDTHMFRIGKKFGFTSRSSADYRAALEITAGFARFSPEDPARYDFALTRVGMSGANDTGDSTS